MRGRGGVVLMAIGLASCGGGSSGPDPVPIAAPPTTTTTLAPAPQPTPTPAPTPCPDPCEPAVTNEAPAARLSIRLFILTDEHGEQVFDWDPEKLEVGWHLTLDATGKDAEGNETNGSKVLRWFIDNGSIVKVGGTHPHQTRITSVAPGQIEVYAKQDGVESNRLRFVFIQ